MRVTPVRLPSTDGGDQLLGASPGTTLVFCYPHLGRPGTGLPSPDWDHIPGARGCTPETCGFRDWHGEFTELGIRVFGVSTDESDYQREGAERLTLPFPLLSDAAGELTAAWRLPVFEAGGRLFLRRLTLLLDGPVVGRVWYPVFPPDRHAAEVLDALRG